MCFATGEDEVYLDLGADHQSVINANPPGTHFVFRSGVHRAVRIVPRDGDVISGEPGAVLNGCLELPDWRREGEWWVHDAPVVTPTGSPGGLGCSDMICIQPQDLYFDGQRLYAAATRDAVLNEDRWFLDRESGRIYLRRDPTGKSIEFGGPVPNAIDGAPPGEAVRVGVVIEDLVIEKYPTPPQIGAVRIGGGSVCRRCEVRQAHAYGIQLMVGAATVQDCYLHDNGMCGIGGTGIDALIEGCEISDNVWSYFAGQPWDNGGIKVAWSANLTIRRCYVHHNHGPGIWTDIRTNHSTIEDNLVEFNDWEGILAEISDHLTIRRNISRWNGLNFRGLNEGALWGGQICLQNSNFIEVESNFVESGPEAPSAFGSGQGIMAINQVERVWDEGNVGGLFGVRNLDVHHNTILAASAAHSGIDYGTLGWQSYEDFLAAEIKWHDNRYLVGQPMNAVWSWRLREGWQATVASWFNWEGWQAYQDSGSTLETFGPDAFPTTALNQREIILQVTGHDYPVLKAELTRRPPPSLVDSDGDGLADVWETHYFGLLDSGAADDPDADGWDNAREFARETDPSRADSDADGLPDAWEADAGLDPRVFDSDGDADGDGRSIREEFEDGTDPGTVELLDRPLPEADVSFWVETMSGVVSRPDGSLESWIEHGPRRWPIGWVGAAAVSGASPTGQPLVDPGDLLAAPGDESIWGTASSGFTLSFVYQPTAIDLSREWKAVLTNESYLQAGFRLRLEGGYLILSSGQSGGTVQLTGHTRLEAGRTYVVTIHSAAPGRRHALYLDGKLDASQSTGLIRPSSNFLMLGAIGGVASQPARFGDVVVFHRALSHRERRTLESLLRQKFQTGFPATDDRDLDGMPDAYEVEHHLDPATPDGRADEDGDGATNLLEFQRTTDPRLADTDLDGIPDGWEIIHGLDPRHDDAAADPDGDGFTNLIEFQQGSDPQVGDSDGDGLPDDWEIAHGLDPLVAGAEGDPDGDGLTNLNELLQGTDPQAADSDHDGMPDGWEITHALNPLVADAAGDADHDEVTNATELEKGTDPQRADTDADGLPDGWEIAHGLDPLVAGAEGDPDGDGATNLTEFFRGLDPQRADTDADGLPDGWEIAHGLDPLANDAAADPDGDGAPNANEFERSTDPQVADTDQDGLPDGWELAHGLDPLAADGDGDLDGDGATNRSEFGKATDPQKADTDDDGMPDGWEIAHGLNPLLDDAAADPDGDGVANREEFAQGADPQIADTDRDGMPNGWEIEHGLDPLVNDAAGDPDGDGATNRNEFAHGTDPQSSDTDQDGMSDGWEISHGLNPLVDDGRGDPDGDGAVNLTEMQRATDPQRADTDGDGMPDGWEIDHFLDPVVDDAAGDPDGDGATNLTEFQMGADPQVADGDQDGLPNDWEIEYSLDPAVPDADGDPDGDGVSNLNEFKRGTNPQSPDTDQDGMTDGWEIAHQLDPLRLDADGDPDGDGVMNLIEQQAGTDPQGADTDQDGIPDGWELNHGLDPLVNDAPRDPDGDGATNRMEFQRATDPQIADTDRDGMPDGWEIDSGLDPLADDATGDLDGDGETNLIEFEMGSDPRRPVPAPAALDFLRPRLWWRDTPGLSAPGSDTSQNVTRWADASPHGHDGVPAAGGDGPLISLNPWWRFLSTVKVSGSPLTTGEVDLNTAVHQPGVTLMVALRPPAAAGPAGVFQPLLTAGGATLGAIEGRLSVRSTIDGAMMAPPVAVSSAFTIVSLTVPFPPGKARLYVDGQSVAEGGAIAPVLSGPVQLGGSPDAWEAEVGEVVVFAGRLAGRERLMWEGVLAGRWQGAGAFAGDTDADGLPDWWEWEAATDPAVNDADADADFDGESNIAAYRLGRSGYLWKDSDQDGMHDGWESSHGLDPLVNDADLDMDDDGLPNGIEHALGTRPDFAGNPPGAWGIEFSGGAGSPVTLRYALNHRSWGARAVPEQSVSPFGPSWQPLAVPGVMSLSQNGTSRWVVPVGSTAESESTPRLFFRLRLSNE